MVHHRRGSLVGKDFRLGNLRPKKQLFSSVYILLGNDIHLVDEWDSTYSTSSQVARHFLSLSSGMRGLPETMNNKISSQKASERDRYNKIQFTRVFIHDLIKVSNVPEDPPGAAELVAVAGQVLVLVLAVLVQVTGILSLRT